jgi:hypothetical protein
MPGLKEIEILQNPLRFYLRKLKYKDKRWNVESPVSHLSAARLVDAYQSLSTEKKELQILIEMISLDKKLSKKDMSLVRTVVEKVMDDYGHEAMVCVIECYNSKLNSKKRKVNKKNRALKLEDDSDNKRKATSARDIDFLSDFINKSLLKKNTVSSRIMLLGLFLFVEYCHVYCIHFPVIPLINFTNNDRPIDKVKMKHALEVYSVLQNPMVFNDQVRSVAEKKESHINDIMSLRFKLFVSYFFILSLHPIFHNIFYPFLGMNEHPLVSSVGKQFYFTLFLVVVGEHFFFSPYECTCHTANVGSLGLEVIRKKRLLHHFPLKDFSITRVLLLIYLKDLLFYYTLTAMFNDKDRAFDFDILSVWCDLLLTLGINKWRSKQSRMIDSTEVMVAKCADSFSFFSELHKANDIKKVRNEILREFGCDTLRA